MIRLRPFVLVIAATVVLTACAPSISPLFRDYTVEAPGGQPASSPDVFTRIQAALTEAGWTETGAAAPNVISTEPRFVSNWGLFRTAVRLDVAPIGEHHVRVIFTPTRHSVFGGRTKIGYLSSGVRRAILPQLNAAFEQQGFVVLGTAQERDEDNHSAEEET